MKKTINTVNKIFAKLDDYELVNILFDDRKIVYRHSTCGKIITKTLSNFYRYPSCNNKECVLRLREDTNLRKFGVKYPAKSEKIRQKMKKTNITKYGVEYPAKLKSIQEKTKKTNLMRYGYENPMRSPAVKQKFYNTSITGVLKKLESHGYELLDSYEGTRAYQHYKKYKIKHITCGKVFYDDVFQIPRCPKCFKSPSVSAKEKYWSDYIKSFGFDVIENDRTVIKPKEIDIYIPDLKIGFEYNGTYWHSSKFKSGTYHEDKTKQALENGVTLIHLWESDSDNFIKNAIDYVLKI